jgi:glycosyltransferase involved in cell wall biosynthesis
MLLSIIIPSFRQSALLKGALESIEMQRFTNYEVLVMDADSQDDTAAIVARFAHLPVRMYSEPDAGIYDAMNKGIARSTGQFLYFMGCDDRLASATVLEQVFADAEVVNNHVLYGDVIFTSNGYRYDGEFTMFKLIRGNICHQAIFTRREVFDSLGKFDIRYKTYADWEFNMRWFGEAWVKRRYLLLVIANFNTTGFSADLKDEVFFAEEPALRKKYFPGIVRYLAFNLKKPLHYKAMQLLTFERLLALKVISNFFAGQQEK